MNVHFLATLGPQHVVLSYFTHSQTLSPLQFPNRNPLRVFWDVSGTCSRFGVCYITEERYS